MVEDHIQYVHGVAHGIRQCVDGLSPHHMEDDLYTHLCMAANVPVSYFSSSASRPDEVFLASLYHDIGKPYVMDVRDDRVYFNGHEYASAMIAFDRTRNQDIAKAILFHHIIDEYINGGGETDSVDDLVVFLSRNMPFDESVIRLTLNVIFNDKVGRFDTGRQDITSLVRVLHDKVSWPERNKIQRYRTCTILVGPPGAGKSAYAASQNIRIVSSDDIIMRTVEGKGYTGKFSNAGRKKIEALFEEELADAIAYGDDVIIDRTNMARRERKKLVRMFTRAGYAVNVVLFVCSFLELHERLKKRHKEEGKFIPDDVVRDMFRKFSLPLATVERFDNLDVVFT